ncbi:DUF3343 domain-containing protein [Anaerospora sp.]|jgi:hypothetical protein|uniref:DUF3343 domain-containing protein n=1 Tax=Anaerospora sp. TaxID=1960278 RepID=UPI00289A332C|nr:DUF3343 domain-containing protein [Anaerospora sp.]
MMVIYPQYDRLLSFASIHHAIRAEKVLNEGCIPVAAAPTPREVDISCGQCLLFSAVNEQIIMDVLNGNSICWSKLFQRDVQSKSYQLIMEYNHTK